MLVIIGEYETRTFRFHVAFVNNYDDTDANIEKATKELLLTQIEKHATDYPGADIEEMKADIEDLSFSWWRMEPRMLYRDHEKI
jgi:hypothetical protein